MPLFLKESIFFKVIFYFFSAFIKAYNNSNFKKNINSISFAMHQSFVAKIFNTSYKTPAFLNSVTYKITLSIVYGIDKIADAIHNLFAVIINKSSASMQFKAVKDSDDFKRFEIISVFVIMIAIGFLTGKVILSDATVINIVIAWAIFFIGCAIVYSKKIISAFKNSLCWYIIKKF